MKWIATLLLAGIIALGAVLVARTLRPVAAIVTVPPVAVEAIDSSAVAARLAAAIRFPTVTDARPIAERAAAFTELRAFLEQAYPRVHATLAREIVAEHTLLYTWAGTDASLLPILLMGHLDVVPVTGNETEWTHPPFNGVIAGGAVWGRGALDDKQHVIAILEAVEALLVRGFQPKRTVLLAFGHDEEAGGHGARGVAELLKQRNTRLHFVLDEGGIIGEKLVPGVRRPVALVKVAEKGVVTLELSVRGRGGHASTPPRPTPVGVLAGAIARLEDKPFPARLDRTTHTLLRVTTPEQPFATRVVLRNLWLFRPLVLQQLARNPASDASIRTTIAPTMLQASPKENVLPVMARAVVNFRVMPRETSRSVIAHVRNAIKDQRVQIKELGVSEAPAPSDPTSAQYALVSRTIREVAPDVAVAPFLLTGATDSRHFGDLTSHIYGFSTARGGSEVMQLAHGTNEHIQIADLVTGVRFYMQLVRNASAR